MFHINADRNWKYIWLIIVSLQEDYLSHLNKKKNAFQRRKQLSEIRVCEDHLNAVTLAIVLG